MLMSSETSRPLPQRKPCVAACLALAAKGKKFHGCGGGVGKFSYTVMCSFGQLSHSSVQVFLQPTVYFLFRAVLRHMELLCCVHDICAPPVISQSQHIV